jgi:hypothetical protein
MRYVCTVHRVTLVVEGNNRRYETPPGSYKTGVPRCVLLTEPHPHPGQAGQCRIEVKG